MTVEYRIGDVFDRLAEIPDGSIDLIVTSPPFLALRSYLPADHPDKGREIGAEPTPAAFLDTLLALSAEWGRVLAPHGSLCVELGDTYSGSGGAGGDYGPEGLRAGQQKFTQSNRRDKAPVPRSNGNGGNGWPLAKSRTMIDTLYPACLAYGRNLLTGQESPAGQWRIRNLIVWARPNPPVGALGDKFRPATSYITVACKGAKRYFDLDAVRLPGSPNTNARTAKGVASRPTSGKKAENPNNNFGSMAELDTVGAPPLDWHADDHPEDGDWLWKLSTQPYRGSHYATFPLTLPKRLIEAMCPQRVCTICGKPSERVLTALTLDAYRSSDRPQTIRAVALADEAGLTDDHIRAVMARGISEGGKAAVTSIGNGKNSADVEHLASEAKAVLGGYVREFTQTTTAQRDSSWSDCGHNAWRVGVVLDPFGGSGTTGVAAQAVGRDCIMIDLDARNADLARERVGMFLEVVEVAS